MSDPKNNTTITKESFYENLTHLRTTGIPKANMILTCIAVLMTAVFSFFILFSSLFQPAIIFVQLILFSMTVIVYCFFAPKMEIEQKHKVQFPVKYALCILLCTCVCIPFVKLSALTKSSAILSVALMFAVMILLIVFVVAQMEPGRKAFDTLDNLIGETVNGNQTFLNGDVVLGADKILLDKRSKDTRIILPFKDRFLHMLIIGPTGSGKTSQILLPMINQDLQNPECGVTILEPKGDLAVKAAMMAKHYGREAVYFDPANKNCPKYNPLVGREVDVIENIAMTFQMLSPDSSQYFKDINDELVRKALKVLKRLDKYHGTDGRLSTLINLNTLLQNAGNKGRNWVNEFSRIPADDSDTAKENADIASWFISDYFSERSKIYENTSGIRSQVSKLVSNEYLRSVLNPDYEKGERNSINFDQHLAEGGVLCISTAQGALRELSKYLGYFLILSFQSSVFRRPGTEDTRRANFFYIDEFQQYSTPGFSDMLTQGRSYRVSSILATQARALMAMGGGRDGKNFLEVVASNARNVVVFPGISNDDAKYFSELFGEYEKEEEVKGRSEKIFNPLLGGMERLGHPTETTRIQKKMTPNFTPTDIMYGIDRNNSFGEIFYRLVKNGSLQEARVGKITYIPKELNQKLNVEVEEYLKENARESAVDYWMHKQDNEKPKEKSKPLFFFDQDDEYDFSDTDSAPTASAATSHALTAAGTAVIPPLAGDKFDIGFDDDDAPDPRQEAAMKEPKKIAPEQAEETVPSNQSKSAQVEDEYDFDASELDQDQDDYLTYQDVREEEPDEEEHSNFDAFDLDDSDVDDLLW